MPGPSSVRKTHNRSRQVTRPMLYRVRETLPVHDWCVGQRLMLSDDDLLLRPPFPTRTPPPPRELNCLLAAGRSGPRVTTGGLPPGRSQSLRSQGCQIARRSRSRAERQRLPPRDALPVHLATENVVARRFGRRRRRRRGRGGRWQRGEQRRE